MRILPVFAILAINSPVSAETVFSTKTLPPRSIISLESVELRDIDVQGAASQLSDVIGLEAKSSIFADRPIMLNNLAKAAIVDRNEIVSTSYVLNGLRIVTEARSLERGVAGDMIKAINLSSRKMIVAEVQLDGSLLIPTK